MKVVFEKIGYRPRAGVWELTLRCNMNCLHCGSRAGGVRGEEMSTEQMLKLADDLLRLGNRRMTLSGGEPLLFEDWPVIVKRLSDGGCVVGLITNGWIFKKFHIDRAKESGLSAFGFSLDGNEKTHDRIRQKPGSHERVLNALSLCAESQFPASVVSHVNRENMVYLREMAAQIYKSGAFAWQVQFGFDAGNLSDHPELLLTCEDIETIVPLLADLTREYEGRMRLEVGDDVGYYTEDEQLFRKDSGLTDYWLGCLAGMQVVGIEANGNIKGCLSMQDPRFVEGNVLEEPFEEIWYKKGNFAYTRDFTPEQLGGYCKQCQYNEFCRGGCSFNAYLHGRKEGKFSNRYCVYQIRELKKQ